MKSTIRAAFFVSASLLLGNTASANDSAFAKIRVRGIDPGPMSQGQKVKFYGRNARHFFDMLPAIAMSVPSEQERIGRVYRFMALESGAWSLNVSCTKAVDPWSENPVQHPNGTECSVELQRPETEGDSFDHHPQCR